MESGISESVEPSKPEIQGDMVFKHSFVEKMRHIRPNKPTNQGIYRPPSRLKLLREMKQEKNSREEVEE